MSLPASIVKFLDPLNNVITATGASFSAISAAASELSPQEIIDFDIQTAASLSSLVQNANPLFIPVTVGLSVIGISTGLTVLAQDQAKALAARQADQPTTHLVNDVESELFTIYGDFANGVSAITSLPAKPVSILIGLLGSFCTLKSASLLIGDQNTRADIASAIGGRIASLQTALTEYGGALTSSFGAGGNAIASALLNGLNALAAVINSSDATFDAAAMAAASALTTADGALLNLIGLSGIAPQSATVKGGTTITNNNGSIVETGNIDSSGSGGGSCTITDSDPSTILTTVSLSSTDAETISTTAQSGEDSGLQTTQTNTAGAITDQTTTFDGITITSASADPIDLTTNASGTLIAEIPSSTPADDVVIESASDGSDQIMIGDPSGAAAQQVIDYGPGGLSGDTINISDVGGSVDITTDIGNGEDGVIASDSSIANVVQDVDFGDPADVLVLENPAGFFGTIFNLLPEDTLDLRGVIATGAAIIGAGTLDITESSGATLLLQLDPSEDYSKDSLSLIGDGTGLGTDILVSEAPTLSGGQTVTASATVDTFNPSSGAETSTVYSGTVQLAATNVQFFARSGNVVNAITPIAVTYTGGNADPDAGAGIVVSDGGDGELSYYYSTRSGTLDASNPTGTIDVGIGSIYQPPDNPQVLPVTVDYFDSSSDEETSSTVDLNVDLQVYTPASPQISSLTYGEFDLGGLHVGQTVTADLVITNAATGAFADSLITSPGSDGAFTSFNGVDLAVGQTGTIAIAFTAEAAGQFTADDSLLDAVSHDAYLPDSAAFSGSRLPISAEVYDYAAPVLLDGILDESDTAGGETAGLLTGAAAGTLTQTGDDSYTLDFGTIGEYSSTYLANILAQNDLPANQLDEDNLEGGAVESGAGFVTTVGEVSYFAPPSDYLEIGTIIPDTTSLGSHTLIVTFTPESADSYGTTDLPAITLTVTDDVVVGGGSLVGLPDVSGALPADIDTELQQILSSLSPAGTTPNVVTVSSEAAAAAVVAGELNVLVLSGATAGTDVSVPGGFRAAFALDAAEALSDSNGFVLLVGSGSNATLTGADDDILIGGNSGATLFATTGAETLIGGTGANAFFLGSSTAEVTSEGQDTITGSSGAETVNASGSALYFGTSGATDFIASGAGGDTIIGGNNGNTVQGGGGSQLIFGSTSLNYTGGAGAATIIGGGTGNTVTGGTGNLLLFASASMTYTGTGGAATVIGGGGPLYANLGTGGGVVYGSPGGNDTLSSDSATASVLVGGGDGDLITDTGSANDVLVAAGGAETINAAASTGNLVIFGGPGSDVLSGGTGNDLFVTEPGSETLTGGGGTNSYVFINFGTTTRTDVITDFNPNTDAIGLYGYGGEPGADAAALASAIVTGGNTTVTLNDGTNIIFTGAPTLNSYNFY